MGFKFIAIFVLNVLDYASTLYGVGVGIFEEVNPLLIELVKHPIYFSIVKLVFVPLFLLVLWRVRGRVRKGIFNLGMNTILVSYSAVMLWHVYCYYIVYISSGYIPSWWIF